MPPVKSSGFCFWTFNPNPPSYDQIPWDWHSSAVFDRAALGGNYEKVKLFSEAIFGLFVGTFGESLGPFAKGKIDWNRIAHDVIRRALVEMIGKGTKVAGVDTLGRLFEGDRFKFSQLLNSNLILKANPFDKAAKGLNNPSINKLLEEVKKIQPLADDEIKALFDRIPPKNNEPANGDDEDGGGSFVLFEFSDARKD